MHADDYPNYYSHHEIDKVPFGRVVIPQLPDGEPGDGIEFTRRMATRYLSGLLVPGCSVPTNQGVLVEVSKRLGAPLIHMNAAFMSPIQHEWVLRDDPEIVGLFQTPGDSMIIVNKHGRRIGNEKTSYNDRSIPHLTFDVERAEYGNLLSFALWDERTNTTWAGAPYGFVPAADGDRSFVVQGDTLEALAERAGRPSGVAGLRQPRHPPGRRLPCGLADQIARFNAMAVAGVDEDFRRGDAAIDGFFHGEAIDNPYPNKTLHPISDDGPYYASIIAPSAIETKGGPRATPGGEILGADDEPIPGLYGVGNCVASATGQAYLSGGITFGPYITFGLTGRTCGRGGAGEGGPGDRARVIAAIGRIDINPRG